MFEASIKTKRFEKGQTIDGTIVAIGPEVAFVDVGGKGEATIAVDELKDDDGDVEVAVGDRIQATVVSTTGGLTLSRQLARGAATRRQLEDAFRAGLPVEGKVEREVKGGYEVRVARQRAFCPISQIDTVRDHRPGGAHRPRLHVPDRRVQGRRPEHRRLAAGAARRGAAGARRGRAPDDRPGRDRDRPRRLGARVRRVRRSRRRRAGTAARVGDGLVARLRSGTVVAPATRSPSRCCASTKTAQKIALGLKQLQRRSVVDGRGDATRSDRSSPGPGHARRGIRRVRRARAGHRRARARVDVPADRASRAAGRSRSRVGTTGAFEILSIDPEKKRIGVALVPEGSARAAPAARDGVARRSPPARALTGKVERHEKFGVFVFLAPGRTGLHPDQRDRRRQRRRPAEDLSHRLATSRSIVARGRSGRPAHSPERQGGCRSRRKPRKCATTPSATDATQSSEAFGVARRQAPRRAQAAREIGRPENTREKAQVEDREGHVSRTGAPPSTEPTYTARISVTLHAM